MSTEILQIANNLGIEYKIIDIRKIYDTLIEPLQNIFNEGNGTLAKENLQARIRGNILMSIANANGGLVLNTGNKTEISLGYCTLYGDMCGAIAVISDLTKTQVYSISKWFNESNKSELIPCSSIDKEPSAELSPGQVDPFNYDKISPLLEKYIIDGDLDIIDMDRKETQGLINKVFLSEHKRRQSAPGLKISKKAFGIGRRFPIVNKFKETVK